MESASLDQEEGNFPKKENEFQRLSEAFVKTLTYNGINRFEEALSTEWNVDTFNTAMDEMTKDRIDIYELPAPVVYFQPDEVPAECIARRSILEAATKVIDHYLDTLWEVPSDIRKRILDDLDVVGIMSTNTETGAVGWKISACLIDVFKESIDDYIAKAPPPPAPPRSLSALEEMVSEMSVESPSLANPPQESDALAEHCREDDTSQDTHPSQTPSSSTPEESIAVQSQE